MSRDHSHSIRRDILLTKRWFIFFRARVLKFRFFDDRVLDPLFKRSKCCPLTFLWTLWDNLARDSQSTESIIFSSKSVLTSIWSHNDVFKCIISHSHQFEKLMKARSPYLRRYRPTCEDQYVSIGNIRASWNFSIVKIIATTITEPIIIDTVTLGTVGNCHMSDAAHLKSSFDSFSKGFESGWSKYL